MEYKVPDEDWWVGVIWPMRNGFIWQPGYPWTNSSGPTLAENSGWPIAVDMWILILTFELPHLPRSAITNKVHRCTFISTAIKTFLQMIFHTWNPHWIHKSFIQTPEEVAELRARLTANSKSSGCSICAMSSGCPLLRLRHPGPVFYSFVEEIWIYSQSKIQMRLITMEHCFFTAGTGPTVQCQVSWTTDALKRVKFRCLILLGRLLSQIPLTVLHYLSRSVWCLPWQSGTRVENLQSICRHILV